MSTPIVGGRGKQEPGGGKELPDVDLDPSDQMLRNRLLAQATLRESTGGTKEIIEEARKALANKQSREQAQVLGDETACGATQRPSASPVEKERKTPLVEVLKKKMKIGPIPVAEYMSTVLADPDHGYYMRRRVFGEKGDFTTAPEISQVFGEMIGVWVAWVWQSAGSPEKVQLVELGPGRGTMMADVLRTIGQIEKFRPLLRALTVHMVETSPMLREAQRKTLSKGSDPFANPVKNDGTGVTIHWHDGLSEVPERKDVPSIMIGQEFLDCMPVRQFRFTEKGWCEKMVDVARPDSPLHFRYVLSPGPTAASKVCLMSELVPNLPTEPELNAGVEVSPDACSYAVEVGRRVLRTQGAALFIDYGHAGAPVETMQAVLKHAFHDPLSLPGEADLTAHVDFAAVKAAVLDYAAALPALAQPPPGLADPAGPTPEDAAAAGAAARAALAANAEAGRADGAGAGGEGGLLVHGPVSQTAFLHALGVRDRIMALLSELPNEESADPQAAEITRQYERLCSSEYMGELFKVMAITPASSKFGCAGFPPPSR